MAASAPSRPKASAPRWVWVAGGVVLLVAAVLLVRARSARGSADTFDTSGAPRFAGAGSAAQQPSGGASSIAGNLPPAVSQPDPVQQQVVQATNAGTVAAQDGGASASTLAAPATVAYTTPISFVNPRPGQTTPDSILIGSSYFTQSAPGSDYFVGEPPSHPGTPGGASMLPPSLSGGNVRRPGFQPDE